jgi:hypothetical protein
VAGLSQGREPQRRGAPSRLHPAETDELASPVVTREAGAGAQKPIADNPARSRVPARAPRPALELSRQPVRAGDASQVVDPRGRSLLGYPYVHSHIGIFA